MDQNNLTIGETYYKCLGEKDVGSTEKYLHSKVQCVSPLVKLVGKKNVIDANKKFISLFKTLKIRSSFGSHQQAMIVYDLECSAPINVFSAAALLTFEDNLISKIELFYDARPFDIKN